MENNKQIVIGLGQIGQAIKKILACEGADIEKQKDGHYDTIHICFPYSDGFIDEVRKYQSLFTPNLTVIHSTVPMGTSKKLNAVHSPVRGKHPDMEEGIRIFVKYFGGEKSKEASKIFQDCGIAVSDGHTSDTTEAMKIWDTTQYAFNIVLEKEIHEYCAKNNLDFNIVYTEANQTYNDGYEKLGRSEYTKYILKHFDGKIGGHCVMSNLKFLNSDIAEFIKKFDEKL